MYVQAVTYGVAFTSATASLLLQVDHFSRYSVPMDEDSSCADC
jgi:hypothetical protein